MSCSESNRSIVDRISAIHQNGNKWKERLSKVPEGVNNSRPISVYNIQEQLHTNQTNWKSRIEQKDVKQFTTESKLFSVQNSDISLHDFESVLKDNNLRTIIINRLYKSDSIDQQPTKFVLKSYKTITSNHNTNAINATQPESKVSLFDNDNQQQAYSHKVKIPQMSDQKIVNFFKDSDADINSMEVSLIEKTYSTDDFDDIFVETKLSLNTEKRSIKPARNARTISKNPLKKLHERLDIIGEYNEIIYDIAEGEIKYQILQNRRTNVGFTKEALAALSAKEDYSRVKLRSTDCGSLFEHFVSPYKEVMLISVKGRKKVQIRLVEPRASSINCGDCYLLVTETQVFVWQGVCANVIEINKVNELGSWIAKCKDLNYKGQSDKPIIIKSNESLINADVVQFWLILGCEKAQQCNNPGSIDEDEIYEQRIQTTNMVFQVVGNQLIALDEYWGRSLKYKLLLDNQVYIFDFGCELYLWSGSKADSVSRRHGKDLLRQLWSKGFDYEQCSINPLDPLPESPEEAKPKKGLIRPDWTIAGRISQKGETILFKEKFSDWPESTKFIKVHNNIPTNYEQNQSKSDLQSIDLEEILNIDHPSVNLIIDGKHVGRGGNRKIIEDGILREYDIDTKNVEAWHINDNSAMQIEERSMGQFCSDDAYIIRWDFELKTLGRFQKHQACGNVTSAFFFWQGLQTSVTEKTASALHTINLDKNKVAQIRVEQHDESPAFCRLFDGSMIIYRGKRKNVLNEQMSRRLFVIRGEIKEESHLIEVPCEAESLRDRSCFVLLNCCTGLAYLWVGPLSSEQSRVCAHYCINSINKKKPIELGLRYDVDIKVEEIRHGQPDRLFWQELGTVKRWRSSNVSLSLEPIRGWLVSSVTNSFELVQLKYSLYPDDGSIPSFPLIQSMLYKASQPALFVISNFPRLYLWQGWCPHLAMSTFSDSDSDVENDKINDWAMPKNRISAEKLTILKSLNSYSTKYKSQGVSVSIIYAGLEPLAFQELFPSWEVNETAKLANLKKGYHLYQEDDITETLDKYLTEKFPLSRLQIRPLPECVVLSKIEWYLDEQEFENLFKMSKDQFYGMTPWKQIEKKKEVNLF